MIAPVAVLPDGTAVVDVEFVPLVLKHWNIDFGGTRACCAREGARHFHFHNLHPPDYPDALFNGCYDLQADRWVWANMEWQGLSDWYGVEIPKGGVAVLSAEHLACDCVETGTAHLAELRMTP